MKHNYIILIVITVIMSSSNVWAAGSGSTKYVACICNKTVDLMYTNGCKKMLTPYSEQLKNDLCLTTLTALNISLKHTTSLAKKVGRLLKIKKGKHYRDKKDKHYRDVITGCFEHIEAAGGNVKDSFNQMNDLGKGGADEDLAFEKSNVQTWMSSAITELDTCRDEVSAFVKDADDDSYDHIKAVLLKGTRTLMKVFSNTLALVNSFADPELHPQECGGT